MFVGEARLERLARDKHSNLLRKCVKSFIILARAPDDEGELVKGLFLEGELQGDQKLGREMPKF